MEPILENGDIVFYKEATDRSVISIGDIVIFNHPTKNIKLIKKITLIKGNGLAVSGVSMEPLLESGDIVFYKDVIDRSSISIGDIVIFNHPTKNIKLIKKISSIQGVGLEVSGENTDFSNDSNDFGLINKNSVVGIVTSRISKKSINNIKFIFNLKR